MVAGARGAGVIPALFLISQLYWKGGQTDPQGLVTPRVDQGATRSAGAGCPLPHRRGRLLDPSLQPCRERLDEDRAEVHGPEPIDGRAARDVQRGPVAGEQDAAPIAETTRHGGGPVGGDVSVAGGMLNPDDARGRSPLGAAFASLRLAVADHRQESCAGGRAMRAGWHYGEMPGE